MKPAFDWPNGGADHPICRLPLPGYPVKACKKR
jgi:hypothetical protein